MIFKRRLVWTDIFWLQFFEEHESVPDSRRKQTEPIDLDTCLQAFTKEEELGEDELYYCSKCKKHCLASKKLDIWRLPPVLVWLLNFQVTVKFLNVLTPKKFAIITLKFEQDGFTKRVMHPKDAAGIANSVDSDHTAPRSSLIWVCSVRPDLSVRKLRIITVCLAEYLIASFFYSYCSKFGSL